MNILFDALTLAEASAMYGLNHSTVKKAIKSKHCPLVKDIDYKKSGNTWLITVNAMKELYGIPGPR